MTRSTSGRAVQPPDEPRIEVVDLLGQTPGAAIEQLRLLDLVPALEERSVDDDADDGLVVDQGPAGGEAARRGDVVTLVVGRIASAVSEPATLEPSPVVDAGDDWYELPSAPPVNETVVDEDVGDEGAFADVPVPAVRPGWRPTDWWRGAAIGGALAAAALVVATLCGRSADSAPEPSPQTVVRTVVETVPTPQTVVRTVVGTVPAPPSEEEHETPPQYAKRPRSKRDRSPPRTPKRPVTTARRETATPSPALTPSSHPEPPPAPRTPCELCFEHP